MAANPHAREDEDVQYAGRDKKGDDRKAFMKTCLSASDWPPRRKGRKQDGHGNKKTAGMAKDERAKAQSECMRRH